MIVAGRVSNPRNVSKGAIITFQSVLQRFSSVAGGGKPLSVFQGFCGHLWAWMCFLKALGWVLDINHTLVPRGSLFRTAARYSGIDSLISNRCMASSTVFSWSVPVTARTPQASAWKHHPRPSSTPAHQALHQTLPYTAPTTAPLH